MRAVPDILGQINMNLHLDNFYHGYFFNEMGDKGLIIL